MPNFENTSAVPPEAKLSEEDRRVMSRRTFLKAAGAVALGGVAPEVLAAPEQRGENVSLRGIELTSFQKQSLSRRLEQLAPGAQAEFALSGPGTPVEGQRLIAVNVIVQLRNGDEKRGRGVAFFPATPDRIEKITREALEDAFEKK